MAEKPGGSRKQMNQVEVTYIFIYHFFTEFHSINAISVRLFFATKKFETNFVIRYRSMLNGKKQ